MAAAGKAQRYEAFVSDVLRRDLRRVQEQRDGVFEQQAQEAAAPLRTQVDLGCNFFVTAEVPSPQRVFVALGYGFFAGLALPEALRHLDRRSRLLDRACGSSRGSRTLRRPLTPDGPWPRPPRTPGAPPPPGTTRSKARANPE
ncbi:protein UXT isoform X3 [Ciconia boyciana]|uniref:protein UXT isoform X3 n=1 Tax=Ciconia boyciana TaxID=52775 RepID=UPI003B9F88B6